MVPLTESTRERLEVLFSGPDRDAAERLLAESCADGLPMHGNPTPESLERVRFAALKVSGGDLAALRNAVDLARVDWRDLLIEAGFAHDVEAHRAWRP